MAITTVHSQLAGMDCVREGDGLDGLISDAGILGSEVIPDARRDRAADQQRARDDHHRQSVGPLWEDG